MATPRTTAELLAEMVEDAKRAAAFGHRTGRLPNQELVLAIADVERICQPPPVGQGRDPHWADAEVVVLQSALSRAVLLISPTTLADLKTDWSPTAPQPFRWGQLAFVVFSLLLMSFTALATFDYNRGAALVQGMENLQKTDARAAMGAIVRQLLNADVQAADPSTHTAATFAEPHFVLIDQLHAIDNQFAFFTPEAGRFRLDHPLPHETIAQWVAGARRLYADMLGSSAAVAAGPAPGTTSTIDINRAGYSEYDVCRQRETLDSPFDTGFANSNAGRQLTDYLLRMVDVLCAEGIKFMPFEMPTYTEITFLMKDWMNFWGLWYLPALYGALGATLYYMRRILDPAMPDPTPMRIIHRIALGAFVGVIITWFWAPNAELSEGFTSIGLTVFTIAFLMGFSVEVIFALLDRIVGSLIDMARGVDRSAES